MLRDGGRGHLQNPGEIADAEFAGPFEENQYLQSGLATKQGVVLGQPAQRLPALRQRRPERHQPLRIAILFLALDGCGLHLILDKKIIA